MLYLYLERKKKNYYIKKKKKKKKNVNEIAEIWEKIETNKKDEK